MNYLISHLKGEQSLAKTFFLNFAGGYILALALLIGIGSQLKTQSSVAIGMAVFFVWFAWALVGVCMCSVKTLRAKHTTTHTTTLVQKIFAVVQKIFAVIALIIVLAAVVFYANDVPILFF